jgi:L-alanine-DL-glutamate epimerase-like enolase superfamily enzyme
LIVAKEIDVEKAASWTEGEAEFNIKYLEDRVRFEDVARVRELRAKKSTKAEDK